MKITNWLSKMRATNVLTIAALLMASGMCHAQAPWLQPTAAPIEDGALPTEKPAGVPAGTAPVKVPVAQVGPAWQAIGPASTTGGQVTVPPNNEIAGCIQALAIHPTNPDIIYVGAVNGGIWRTTNGTAVSPTWTPLSDNVQSLGMGALEFDPTDPTFQTLVAASARESSLGGAGSGRIGVLRTTDGGASWTVFGTSQFVNENLSSIAGRGTVIMAGSDTDYTTGFFPANGSGLFRSTNTGASFTLVSGTSGLTAGPVSDVIGDPGNPNRFFAAVRTVGIFRSDDTGATWTNVTSNLTGISSTTPKVEMAMFNNGATTAVYVAVLGTSSLAGVWRSTNLGASWTQMDTPATGGQTSLHFAIGTDRTNPALVYVGGQSGRFRGDATLALGSQFTSLQSPNSSGTTPHADAREMFCDSTGTLYDAGDGGLYRRPNPTNNTTAWNSANGNLAIFEAHDVAYDAVNHVAMIGTQDNGTQTQPSVSSTVWTWTSGGDGGDVAIDDTSTPGQSIRYGSSQNLGGFYRKTYDSSNVLLSTVSPTLTILGGGPAISTQFTTPVELNKVDATRLIIGGGNAAYESLNRGDSITALTPISGVGGTYTGKPIAYGGWLTGVPNPDILYYGSGSTVKIRTTAGGAVADTAAAFPGGTVNDIVLDRNDYRRVFVAGASSVYYSTNSGGSWTNITGDLTGVGTTRTIEFFRLYGTDCIAVGTELGVFCSFVNNLGVWQKLGTGLPNAVVFDMKYSEQDSMLVIGTLGRSCFKLPVSPTPLTYLTINLSASVVTEGDGPVTATLTATPAPVADLTVTLTSGDTGEATVPATATILAGQTSTTFQVTVINDLLIDGTQTPNITASAAGYTDGVAVLTVQDDETATLSVTAPATMTEGAAPVQGTVGMSVTAVKAVTVSLSSSDLTAVTVPATVTIPAGQSTANFPITAVDDNKIDGTQNATITAHITNWTDGIASIAVLDNENLNLSLALPATVTEAGSGSGSVSISGTRTTPLTVTLTSNTTSRLTVPATVTILAGSTSVGFTLTAPDNSLTDGSAPVLINAGAVGFTPASGTTTVLDNDVHHFVVGNIASPQGRAVPFSITVTAKDLNDVTLASYAATASLSANGASGPDAISPTSTGAFTAGVWTGNVTISTFDTNVILTVSVSGRSGSSNPFTVSAGPVDHFVWNTVPTPQNSGVPFATTVTAQDLGNNTATGFTGTANLRGYYIGPSTSTIIITEANPNTPDEIEFMNVGNAAVDVSGWQVYLYDDISWPAPLSVFTIPAGSTCAAGQIFRLQEFGTSPGTFPLFFTGANISWTSATTSHVAVLLRDATSAPVDFVCAAVATPASITSPQVIPAGQWSGAQITGPTNTAFGYLRVGFSDGNTAADWTTNTPSIGTANTGLTVPFGAEVSVPILPGTSGNFVAGVWTGNVMTLQSATQMRLRADDGAGHTGDSNTFNSNGSANAEISVEQPALNVLTDGVSTVDFGTAGVGGDANVKTFVIRNVGGQVLTISGITGNGTDIASFTFPALTGVAIQPAGSVSFIVQFTATSAGAKTAAIHIGSNDADENPFDIALTGTGAVSPEIKIEQPSGTERADGSGTIAFGDSVLGVPVVKTLTIRNTGGAVLNLGAITVDGANSGEFVAGAPSSPTVAAAGTATLNVTFTPTSAGARSAVLHVVNNDPNENPYDLMLIGIGSVPSGLLHLVRDINQTGAGPGITAANTAVIGNTMYFAANTADLGTELWKSDGTAAGTALVKDINPGINSGSPANFLVIGSTLYFSANSGTTGAELWKSDGTTAGTVLVKDIFSGTTASNPANLTNVAGTLFFTASDSTANGTELWKSDGTTAGTVLVLNINAIANTSSSPTNLRAVGSTLFFTANDGVNGVELWKSDGTAAGTVLVRDIFAGITSSSPANLVAVGSTLVFSANDGANGFELWKSDGTTAGTVLVLDIFPGSTSSSPTALVNAGGTLFFRATTAANGSELWKTDGTAAGTVLVLDINPGTAGSVPSNLFAVGSIVYFSANDGAMGTELWKSDGTAAGTVLVSDVSPGSDSSSPSNFTLVGTTLYFSATTGTLGTELWKTDGTAAGTVLVEDINPGAGSSSPGVMFSVGGSLVFLANDGANGPELWWSDGTAAGTNLIRDIVPGDGSAAPANLRVLGSALLFNANDGVNGVELWRSDGLPGGTTLLKDISVGAGSSSPGAGVVIGSTLYFPAFDSAGGTELWKTDGTLAGTVRAADIFPGITSSSPANLAKVGTTLYFTASGATVDGTELWKSDGTAAGTVLVSNINPTANTGSFPANLTDFNGTLFFTASDGTNGVELWKSDGTAAGTVLVKDINAGSISSLPSNLRVIGSTLYFTAITAAEGTELWKTDGTTAGTVIVTDLYAGTTSSSPSNLTVIGSTLYFSASTPATSTELWKTDGTAAGTVLVSDIFPGTGGSFPSNLTAVGSTLFFSASGSGTGNELWKSDGTSAGTVLVKDIVPGTGSSSPTTFASVNGTLFFTAGTTADGRELWKSDGTDAGTVLAADIRPGVLSSSPTSMTAIGDRLFFVATGADLGTELWTLDLVPDIALEQPIGTGLVDGLGSRDFGSVALGENAPLTFTIRNTGTANLTGTGNLTGLTLTKDGTNNGDFTLGSLGVTTLTPGTSTTFTVTFAPGAVGPRSAAIHVGSNDPDENSFDVAVTGTGLATHLEGWRFRNFGSAANSGNGANANDFEFDGFNNFMEFCLGTDPKQPSQPAQSLVRNGSNLEFTYLRATVAVLDSVVFSVEWIDDLTQTIWSTAGVTEMILSDNGVIQQVKATVPAGTAGERFLRLKMTGN